MKTEHPTNIGMKRIIQRLRSKFEIEENINHYSVSDFLKAERKYIKFMLEGNTDSLNLNPWSVVAFRDQ